ncbi:MAG: hypothetical protein ACNA8W_26570, partial [Bradymonadaceae bacterium]
GVFWQGDGQGGFRGSRLSLPTLIHPRPEVEGVFWQGDGQGGLLRHPTSGNRAREEIQHWSSR